VEEIHQQEREQRMLNDLVTNSREEVAVIGGGKMKPKDINNILHWRPVSYHLTQILWTCVICLPPFTTLASTSY